MKENRILWVDIAKYICIMFVMLSHLESSTVLLSVLYSPFFLTLFFFCSGYVYKADDSFGKFILKKVKQLFVPWLILSTANIAVSQILTFNEHKPFTEELFWNFLQIRGMNDGLWFVAALFVAFVPFFFFIKWYQKKSFSKKRICFLVSIGFILSFLSNLYGYVMDPAVFPWGSCALPWHLEYIFIAMFYMLMGFLFKHLWENKFDDRNTAVFRFLIWAVYCIVICIDCCCSIDNVLLAILFSYIPSILGIAAVISVCKIIRPNKYILYIGKNSLLCFALHGKVYSLLQTVLKKFAGGFYFAVLDNVFTSSLFAILLTFVMSIILIVPIYIINRYFPFVIGRAYKKNA